MRFLNKLCVFLLPFALAGCSGNSNGAANNDDNQYNIKNFKNGLNLTGYQNRNDVLEAFNEIKTSIKNAKPYNNVSMDAYIETNDLDPDTMMFVSYSKYQKSFISNDFCYIDETIYYNYDFEHYGKISKCAKLNNNNVSCWQVADYSNTDREAPIKNGKYKTTYDKSSFLSYEPIEAVTKALDNIDDSKIYQKGDEYIILDGFGSDAFIRFQGGRITGFCYGIFGLEVRGMSPILYLMHYDVEKPNVVEPNNLPTINK